EKRGRNREPDHALGAIGQHHAAEPVRIDLGAEPSLQLCLDALEYDLRCAGRLHDVSPFDFIIVPASCNGHRQVRCRNTALHYYLPDLVLAALTAAPLSSPAYARTVLLPRRASTSHSLLRSAP